MKSKPLTYTLIIAVAAVWGIIFYRIFLAANLDEDQEVLSKPVKKEVLEDYTFRDTFKLALNYRDPFLGKPMKEEFRQGKDSTRSLPKHSAIKPQAPEVNWAAIKYSGFIVNPGNKKIVSIISVNNHELTIGEGETTDGLKLLKNLKDSVKIIYQGKTKFISLK